MRDLLKLPDRYPCKITALIVSQTIIIFVDEKNSILLLSHEEYLISHHIDM